jgi:predicted dehydrogenase
LIENIILYGGGRWSKVWFGVLNKAIQKKINIIIIPGRGYESFVSFLSKTTTHHHILIYQSAPNTFPINTLAIIANSAGDHFRAASHLLNLKIPVLVEKPVSLSVHQIQALIELSNVNRTIIAPAHVYKFSNYLVNFKQYLKPEGLPSKIDIEWTDSEGESTQGFSKNYDAGIPVFYDCMPHIVSLIEVVFESSPSFKGNLEVENGGSKVTFLLSVKGINCNVLLQRNAKERNRKITVTKIDGDYSLDFKTEPGQIFNKDLLFCADKNWAGEKTPLEKMINDFIDLVERGDIPDGNFNLKTALTSSKISEEINKRYKKIMAKEIQKILDKKSITSKDSIYAIRDFFRLDRNFLQLNLIKKVLFLKKNYKNLSLISVIKIAKNIN